ncbi:MAG: NADH-ubiquinone oxidoreductase-F iron-sulfur binding region domain-containing protein [Deferrisomatales bacterium]|nr:NADH-ubiquinone oxidoreductase-F iron-sulfur binding region domain-containing protein [Deferrisomatales bacterium]
MQRIGSPDTLEELRAQILSERDPDAPCIAVCAAPNCHALGNGALVGALAAELESRDLRERVRLRPTGCLGFCEQGPVVIVYPQQICYVKVAPEDAAQIVAETVLEGRVVQRLLYTDPESGQSAERVEDIPFYRSQSRVLIGANAKIDPRSLEDYLAIGGYAALSKALFQMSPEQVLGEVKASNLRGRGGGGFPAGSKWETTRNAPGDLKYVIVNAHEGEPGAFMDRALFTGNPHAVLEGLIIGAYAIGARQGFIYTRHDSPQLLANLYLALDEARARGLLGTDILGSGFAFDVEVHFDVGIFVSGESSALMRSLEGKMPEPRPKYVRTSVSGVFDRPSNLNNVETWANVPHIINNGAAWFAGIGTEKSKGSKLLSLSGSVNHIGVVEVPMGTPLRTVVEVIGGGVAGGKALKAVHFGGPMGGSIPAQLIDTPVDFDALGKLGAPMGAGAMLVLDEDTCMVDLIRFFLEFLTKESCGKCTPCREGCRQMLNVVTGICEGRGQPGDIELLEEIAEVMSAASLCSLGKTASDPLRSALRYYRDEYVAHIQDQRCPAGACASLTA